MSYIPDLPGYMKISNNVIYINIAQEEWELQDKKKKAEKVKMQDVVDYFAKYGGSAGFLSSYRFLGQIGGDWRPIDQLANECLYIFRMLNSTKLKTLCRRANLTTSF